MTAPRCSARLNRCSVGSPSLPEGAVTALVLWTTHTFAIDTTWISPLSAITSPTKRCGKTTILMIVSALAARALPASSISPAALYRAVQRYRPTLLLDEAETWLRDNDELRGLINAGHTRRTAVVIRTVGEQHEPVAFSTWCPKLMALIGKLPETLTDRSIVIPMRRRTKREVVERLRLDRLPDICDPLRRQLQRWVDDQQVALHTADPETPRALHDRASDNWRPLFAIADAAGGEWPSRARAAALLLSGCDDDDDQPMSVLLLSDLRQIFGNDPRTFVPTEDLLSKLGKLKDRPWATWGKQEKLISSCALAGLLRPYDVHPRSDGSGRGYDREPKLTEAWERYLNPVGATGTDGTDIPGVEVSKCQGTNNGGPETPFSKCQDETGADTLEMPETPTTTGSVDTLTLPEAGSGHPEDADEYPKLISSFFGMVQRFRWRPFNLSGSLSGVVLLYGEMARTWLLHQAAGSPTPTRLPYANTNSPC